MRIYNSAGNQLYTAPYRIELSVAARDWVLYHDSGYLPAIGTESDYTDWHRHTFYNAFLEPGDHFTISVIGLTRQSSSFWPDFNLQFQRIRLTLNTSYEQNLSAVALGYENWLYGEWSSPEPPPPPLTG